MLDDFLSYDLESGTVQIYLADVLRWGNVTRLMMELRCLSLLLLTIFLDFPVWRVGRFPNLNAISGGSVVLVMMMKVEQLMYRLILLTTSMIDLRRRHFGRAIVMLALRPMIARILSQLWRGYRR